MAENKEEADAEAADLAYERRMESVNNHGCSL